MTTKGVVMGKESTKASKMQKNLHLQKSHLPKKKQPRLLQMHVKKPLKSSKVLRMEQSVQLSQLLTLLEAKQARKQKVFRLRVQRLLKEFGSAKTAGIKIKI